MTPVAPARKILILAYSAKHMRRTSPFDAMIATSSSNPSARPVRRNSFTHSTLTHGIMAPLVTCTGKNVRKKRRLKKMPKLEACAKLVCFAGGPPCQIREVRSSAPAQSRSDRRMANPAGRAADLHRSRLLSVILTDLPSVTLPTCFAVMTKRRPRKVTTNAVPPREQYTQLQCVTRVLDFELLSETPAANNRLPMRVAFELQGVGLWERDLQIYMPTKEQMDKQAKLQAEMEPLSTLVPNKL
jgi:hypothetical protein